MTIDALRTAHEKRPFEPFEPFEPFALVLADGTRVAVPHPEFLAHPRKGRTVIEFEQPDRYRVVVLPMVSALAVDEPGSDENGRSRHRRGPA